MAKKTRKRLQVERDFGKPLEDLLPELVTEKGLSDAAAHLGVSKASLGYWLLKLGLTVKRVCLRPGEYIVVKKSGEQ